MRTVWIVVGVVLLVLVVLALGGAGIFYMMPQVGPVMGGRFGGRTFGLMGFGFGIIGWIVRFGLLVLIIAGLAALVSWFARTGRTAALPAASVASQSPLDILKTRYARGEITKEQYDQLKHDLELP